MMTFVGKYPEESKVTLVSSFSVKKAWLSQEVLSAEMGKYIRRHLLTATGILETREEDLTLSERELIVSTFHEVRGKFSLWGKEKDQGHWERLQVPALKWNWISENVEILYPKTTVTRPQTLKGIVLWRNHDTKRFELLEGNHRISGWKNSGTTNTAFTDVELFLGCRKSCETCFSSSLSLDSSLSSSSLSSPPPVSPAKEREREDRKEQKEEKVSPLQDGKGGGHNLRVEHKETGKDKDTADAPETQPTETETPTAATTEGGRKREVRQGFRNSPLTWVVGSIVLFSILWKFFSKTT